jgi:hypothetical protein
MTYTPKLPATSKQIQRNQVSAPPPTLVSESQLGNSHCDGRLDDRAGRNRPEPHATCFVGDGWELGRQMGGFAQGMKSLTSFIDTACCLCLKAEDGIWGWGWGCRKGVPKRGSGGFETSLWRRSKRLRGKVRQVETAGL